MLPNDFTGGPGYFTFDGLLFQLMDDSWETNTEIVNIEKKTNIQGTIGHWEEYVKTTVTGKPIALYSLLATQFAKLFPYRPSNMGQRLRSNTDKPLVIQTTDGRSITFTTAALTKMPSLQFSPNKDLFGSVEFTCLRKQGDGGTGTDAHVVEASSAYTEPLLDPDDIVNCKFSLALGSSSPLNVIECDEEGVTVEPQVQLGELPSWNEGLLNWQINGVTCGAKFTPQNQSQATLLNTLVKTDGTGVGRGTRLGARGLPLTVTTSFVGGPVLTIPLACANKGRLRFGSASRIGEVELYAERTLNDDGDAWLDLFTLDVVPEA